MKLWMRVYMLTLPLALLFTFGISAWLLRASFAETMQREYDRGLVEHAMLISALQSYVETAQSTLSHDSALKDQALVSAVRNYGRYYTADNTAIAVESESDGILFTSMSARQAEAIQLSPPTDGARQYVLRRVDGRYLLYVSGWFSASRTLKIDYMRDISASMNWFKDFSRRIAWVLLGAAGLLGIGMYLLIHSALRPIRRLVAHSRRLVAGHYEARLQMTSGEMGELATTLNELAGAVSARIEQMERAARDRDMFIANLAHEMKTPMTTILGYADLLSRMRLDEGQKLKALSSIRSEGKRLEALSAKLLELFRLRGSGELTIDMTSIPDLLARAGAALQYKLDEAHQVLKTSASVREFPLDAALFEVLLIDNAMKASGDGAEIAVDVYPERDTVIFEVRDRGAGIAQEELASVTQPFYMVDKARSRALHGAGLGLTLCETIAKAHGGALEIISALGEGARVRVILTNPIQNASLS